jgi:hypothetical protein
MATPETIGSIPRILERSRKRVAEKRNALDSSGEKRHVRPFPDIEEAEVEEIDCPDDP